MNARAMRFVALGLAAAALVWPAAAGDLFVRGETLYTMDGPPVKDGVVWVHDGRIKAVGPASKIPIPAGASTRSAKVVTPGLIDAHTVTGLTGYLNQPTDQDQLDATTPIQPELRALDAYNPRERLVDWQRGFGVTTLHTGHAPGAAVSGQTMIVKTRGRTVEEAVVVPFAMVAATLGSPALVTDTKKSPGTRSKVVALLRAELVRAAAYRDKLHLEDQSKRPDPDLHLEALVAVLDRKVPLLVTADREADIDSALRVAREFKIVLILDSAAESYELIQEIRAAGASVIVHPTMYRAAGDRENLSLETAGRLRDAGIPVALQSGYETYVPKTRVVLFEAAIAAANGLGFDRALEAITLGAARILGIEGRVGSLTPGKDGDLALFDGDPFEYTSHCLATVIEGEVFESKDVRGVDGERP